MTDQILEKLIWFILQNLGTHSDRLWRPKVSFSRSKFCCCCCCWSTSRWSIAASSWLLGEQAVLNPTIGKSKVQNLSRHHTKDVRTVFFFFTEMRVIQSHTETDELICSTTWTIIIIYASDYSALLFSDVNSHVGWQSALIYCLWIQPWWDEVQRDEREWGVEIKQSGYYSVLSPPANSHHLLKKLSQGNKVSM